MMMMMMMMMMLMMMMLECVGCAGFSPGRQQIV